MCMIQSFLLNRGKNVPACMGVSALGGYVNPNEDKRETPRFLVLSAQGGITYVRFPSYVFSLNISIYPLIRRKYYLCYV